MPKLRDISYAILGVFIPGLVIWGLIAWLGWYVLLIPGTLLAIWLILFLDQMINGFWWG